MSLAYRKATVDAMWAILAADADWSEAFDNKRQIRSNGTDWLKEWALRAPSDFPHVWIRIGDRAAGQPYRMETFEADDPDYRNEHGVETATADVSMRLVYDSEQQATDELRDALEMGAITAFRGEGRTLGLDWLVNWSYTLDHRKGMVDDTVRPVTTLTFAMQYEFVGSILQPA
jgi:hypothetical protein